MQVLVPQVAARGAGGAVLIAVVGLLQLPQHQRSPCPALPLPLCLCKSHLLLRALGRELLVVVLHRARQLVSPTHVMHLGRKRVVLVNRIEQVAVGRQHPHRRVLALLAAAAVAAVLRVVEGEGVVPVALQVVQPHAALQLPAPFLLPQGRGTQHPEAAGLHRHLQVRALLQVERGLGGLQVQHVAGGIGACRHQALLLLSLAQAHIGRVAQQVASQIHLAVLRVADGDAVDGHRRELAPQPAGRHRLHAAHPTVVLQRHPRHLAHRVAQLQGARLLDDGGVHHLGGRRGDEGCGGVLGAHLQFVEGAYGVLCLS